MKKLLLAMAIGAGLAWALDPDQGARRRARLRGQLESKGILTPSEPTASPSPFGP